MRALETMHGWGSLPVTAGIFWSAPVLLLAIAIAVAIVRLWPRRQSRSNGEQPPARTAH